MSLADSTDILVDMNNDQYTPPDLLNHYQKSQENIPQKSTLTPVRTTPVKKKRSIILTIIRVIFFTVLILVCLALLSIAINLKGINAIYQGVTSGKTNLETALYSAQARDFTVASEKSDLAIKNFTSAA